MNNKNLTMNDFWIPLSEKYPIETEKFYKWVDEYKKLVNWNGIFNVNAQHQDKVAFVHIKSKAPKYHDLPIAMQFGIFLEFASEKGNYSFGSDEVDYAENWPKTITSWFEFESNSHERTKG